MDEICKIKDLYRTLYIFEKDFQQKYKITINEAGNKTSDATVSVITDNADAGVQDGKQVRDAVWRLLKKSRAI
jgi:hypothetical protein